MSWRSESPFTVGFRAYVGFWFHCSPNPIIESGAIAPRPTSECSGSIHASDRRGHRRATL
ncbi:hypothetical protein GFL01_02905 [Pseudomonas stutzeri]|nr:hypothetical protein [Stutzerimonas frequens]